MAVGAQGTDRRLSAALDCAPAPPEPIGSQLRSDESERSCDSCVPRRDVDIRAKVDPRAARASGATPGQVEQPKCEGRVGRAVAARPITERTMVFTGAEAGLVGIPHE